MAYLTLMAAWTIAVISPGPDFLAVLRGSATRGRRQGFVIGLGVVMGIACWATLALTGLSLLLARYAHLYLIMRAIGAIFLVLYGLHIVWSLWRSRREEQQPDSAALSQSQRRGHPFRLGMATNLANPKAVLFFGALFASLMPPNLSVYAKFAVVVAMLALALGWFFLVAGLAGSHAVMRGYRRIQRKLDAVAGGLFVAIGAALLPR